MIDNVMPNINPEGHCQCQDVKHLIAGKKYMFSVDFVVGYLASVFHVKRHISGLTGKMSGGTK